MDKRFALALGLSLLVWMVWFLIFKPQPERPGDVRQAAVQTGETKQAPHPTSVSGGMTAQRSIPVQNVKEEVTVSLETDKYKVKLSNRGAKIESLMYLYGGRKIELVVPAKKLESSGIKASGELEFNLYQEKAEFQGGAALDSILWSQEKASATSVKFSATVRNFHGAPLVYERVYEFHKDKYYFDVHQTVRNVGRAALSMPENRLIASTSDFLGPDMDFSSNYNRVESVYYLNDGFETGSQGGGLFSSEKELQSAAGQVKWAGVRSRYFLMLMVPQGFAGTGVIHEGRRNHGVKTGIEVPVGTLQPGESATKSFKVYVGEKNKQKLVDVDPILRDAADINILIEPIRDFLIWCLMKINLLFGNFGWSLIIFSILTKIVLMPLTLKSTESMKRLQELSPKIKEIQSKYKDKPEVMNKKVMELYKKEKVNPLSGCLPLLLQMPFFFALYSALINSIDLWQAPFILWINDLSMPDTVYTIPHTMAFMGGFNINILPLVMTATTYLQQKMTPGGDSTQQKMFMKLMPFIFLFIFWSMPSGLILYWIMQNVLQVLHQLYINRRAAGKTA